MLPIPRALFAPSNLRSIYLGQRKQLFHVGRQLWNSNGRNSSVFEGLTKDVNYDSNDPSKLSNRMSVSADTSEEAPKDGAMTPDQITVDNDATLHKYIRSKQGPEKLAHQTLLSPLKRKLYMRNCELNDGVYKRDTVITLPGSKEKYRLKLSREEIDVLEPSVYVKSYRIKSSMKKTTQLLRLLNGLDVKTALTQCHFSSKKIARDVAEVLNRGIEDGQKLGLNENDMYIAQIWTGSDGWWVPRMDYKGRGRVGVIRHRYVHVRCILKTKSVTKRRLEYESQLKQQRRKPWVQLADKPVRGFPGGAYKW
ncbi:hypothetical protein ZYGR_0AI04000 [Zygosaccharomyces rouxii]|uniref:54S ribosomal protein L22, mitochondrial n=1 Tax=Zygosaccharomyces rouxii TaxID=4956 RepID=A0A1Q3ABU2_ZYGRO|nr:hypothetical protein ZYGR_0AI04000 [Zygosaccharomyces rouxii]